jgi:NAD(P)-dependent dehydrogenase (short-subunit alcohol dehydrogenase family)
MLTYNSNEKGCAGTVREVELGGGTATAVPRHLGNRASIEKAMGAAATRYGGLDALVTNAVSGRPMPRACQLRSILTFGRTRCR